MTAGAGKLASGGEPRIVAINPGRVNLVTALDSQTGKINTLTRRVFYVKGRIKECNRKVGSWEVALGDINSPFVSAA